MTCARWTSGDEDLGSDHDVLLHVLVLAVGERPLLAQHILANADLPDVVQAPAGTNQLDLFVAPAHLRGHHGGHVGDAGRMTAQVRVLRLERVHQGLERRERDPLQVLALELNLGGADRDFLLEPLVELLAFQSALALLERALDGPAEMGDVDRLGEIVHGAALHAERGAGRVVDRGEHEQRDVRLQLHDLWDQLDAVHRPAD